MHCHAVPRVASVSVGGPKTIFRGSSSPVGCGTADHRAATKSPVGQVLGDFLRKRVQARRVSTIYNGALFDFSRHSTTFTGYRESVETARFLRSRATSASTFSDRRRQLDVARSRRPPSRFHDNETPTWRNSKSVRLSRVVGSANVSCPV